MANIGAKVLSRCILDGDMLTVLESHIDASWFNEDDGRVFDYLRVQFSKHGEVPSTTLVRENFPAYRVADVDDAIEPLLEEFRRKRRELLTKAMVGDAVELIEEDGDYEGARALLTKALAALEVEVMTTSDLDLVTDGLDRLAYYATLKDKKGMLGLPTGFPTMDEATSGLQPEQLICIVATPKVGKSTLMMVMARAVSEIGKKPLVVSFEMSGREQASRYDAFRAGINHQRLTRGTMTRADEKALAKAAKDSVAKGHSFIVAEDIAASTTVSGIAAKIEQHKPDVCFIDGVYLMHDELGEDPGSPQALTNITRNLKRLAQRTQIPIVMSTQALPSKVRRKEGVTGDSIGYSSSFFQDSDVLFGLQPADDDDLSRTLRIINARNAGKREVTLAWDWENSVFAERVEAEFTVGKY